MNPSQSKPFSPSRALLGALLALAGLALAAAVDKGVYANIGVEGLSKSDWHRALRSLGYLPVWLMVAAALVMHDWPRRVGRGLGAAMARGAFVAAATVGSGIAGEILKLIIRRERPDEHGGESVFRPFTERLFESGGLATPSSHAVVAFAGAWALCRLFPRGSLLWVALAAGCGLTRILDRAHFVSDIFLAALLSLIVTRAAERWVRRPLERDAAPEGVP